ncbi:MAG TPA: S41 family peptidase, partial [candidate division Zixibacteria bacterium]|nr:S41 family peptidase [candidate division Zixibacteria bacterium]
IGVSLGFHHDTLTVESVMEGTPGYNRGIIAGDRIISIDGTTTTNLNIRQIKMILRGQRGSTVSLGIFRPDMGAFNLKIERAKVEIKAIPFYSMVKDNVGYIRLARFSSGSSSELHNAIRDLKRLGMTSLILDM